MACWDVAGRDGRVKQRVTIQGLSFVAVVLLVTAAFIWLLIPYYGAVLWAVILAVLFHPLQRWLVDGLGGRRNLAAALSLLACICIVVIPGSVILASLTREAAGLYTLLSSRQFDFGGFFTQMRDALPEFMLDWLSFLNFGTLADIQQRITTFLTQASQWLATQALTIGQNTAQFLIALGVMLYLLFFLFRDGEKLVKAIRAASPLSVFHTEQIFSRFADVIKATVKGNVIIAVIQGTIGGVTFSLLGIEPALLWGVLMAALSLLPAVGSFLVWGPVAIWLLISGQYVKGLILLAVGALVISLIDNLLRPVLVGRGARLPDYVVLVSTVGGLSLFGMHGFVVGPLIAALFVAVWSLLSERPPPR